MTQLLLPALILGIATGAALMRLTRGMLLEVLRQDYVRTAWAKGLAERVIVMKHGLRNAIIPVVTLLGTQLPQVIGGTVIIETVFGLPGMSRFLFDAINQRDYPVIQGVNLVVVSLIVLDQPHGRRALCRSSTRGSGIDRAARRSATSVTRRRTRSRSVRSRRAVRQAAHGAREPRSWRGSRRQRASSLASG